MSNASDDPYPRHAVPSLDDRLRAAAVVTGAAGPPPIGPAGQGPSPVVRKKPSILKRWRRWFKAIASARKFGERLQALEARVDWLSANIGHPAETAQETSVVADAVSLPRSVEARLAASDTALRQDMESRLAAFGDRLANDSALSARAHGALARRLDLLRYGVMHSPPAPHLHAGDNGSDGASHDGTIPAPEGDAADADGLEVLLDSFYHRLENRYRGGREEIARRVAIYLPDAEAAYARTGRPVLDLGCGRGEWLEVLAGRGVPSEGVDLNPVQLAAAREAGLAVRQTDAMAALRAAPDSAYAMITAHHLVEHLPFRTVGRIAREAQRVLAPGGILLFETPNTGNLLVGGSSFYNDPTHLRPLTEPVLTVLFETMGFHPIETRLLHPHEKYAPTLRANRLDPDIVGLLFGPQDLAVLGVKPAVPSR